MGNKIALKGEGDIQIIKRERVRIECEFCGEPADERHTYLLPNARRNPGSSAYRHDDCTWCSDHEVFTCADCRKSEFLGHAPSAEGFEWCSTFALSDRFAHMFLHWKEIEIADPSVAATDLLTAFKDLVSDIDDVDDGRLPSVSAATLTRARAAIARAEGGAQ